MKAIATVSIAVLSLAGAAYAADLPTVKSAPPAPVPVLAASDWTGVYGGLFGGYGAGTAAVTPGAFLTGIGAYPVTLDPRGGFAGLDLGYNYQTSGGFVFGGVVDWAWADLKGTTCVNIGEEGVKEAPAVSGGRCRLQA